MFDQLRQKIVTTNSHLCLGMDPDLAQLPKSLRQDDVEKVLLAWGETLLAAAKGKLAAVKPQMAYFEAYGLAGYKALHTLMASARRQGFITVLDGKRGDIASTMAAYGTALFDELGADIMTVNAYMGTDVLTALLPWLRRGKAVYVVLFTSNPSWSTLQSALMPEGNVGARLFHQLTAAPDLADVQAQLGWVVGAQRLDDLSLELWADLQHRPLLLPGLGAQRAAVTPRLRELAAGADALFPQSRGLAPQGDFANWDAYGVAVAEMIERARSGYW